MRKIFIKTLSALIAAITLLSFSGCFLQKVGESEKPLTSKYGSANQTYLYGMTYNISERDYTGSNYDPEKEIKLLNNLGVKTVRLWTHVKYSLFDPDTPKNSVIEKTAKVIELMQFYGMRVICMNHTSFHDGSYASGKPARDITEGSYYINWLYDYYKSWKTLVTALPQIEYFEIDNEMNNQDFMCDINGEKIYSQQEMADIATDMLYYASRGIHEANPNAKTIIGGLTEPDGLGSGQNKSFFEKLYANIESGEYGYFYDREDKENASVNPDDYFEIACWHPYIGGSDFNADNFVKFNADIYDVILKHEKKHKKVFFTEIGFSDDKFGEENCARFITEMYTTVKTRMPYVESVYYFKPYNTATVGWTGSVSRFGLFYDPDPNRKDVDRDDATKRNIPGKPKSKAYAYQEVAGGSGSLEIMQTNYEN